MDSRTIFRFCPRCGKPAIAHEGKHAIRCSACNFLFFFNAATAVGAIIPDKDGRLLFLRRAKEPAKGKLGMPGGFVDRGETVETALAREVREEVNLEVERMEYLCSAPNTYAYHGITYVTADLFFICTVRNWSALKALDEVDACELLHPGEVKADSIAFDSMRHAIGEYRRKYSSR